MVGIGASAGGLEAVSELLGALPAGTNMAYLVVQHLDPRHESQLPEILAKRAAMPVSAAVDREVMKADHVYVIPPNTTLTVAEGRLRLERRPTGDRHHPVDALFKSLAETAGEYAIGVVLSGGDSDGSLGIKAIKQEGGFVFAQVPDSARVPSMPQSAIETGSVDRVLRPRDIAREIVRLSRFSRRDAVPEAEPAEAPEPTTDDDVHLKHILRRLRAAHGLDFTHYKRNMLLRRLARRMMLRNVENLADYRALIDTDPEELGALHQDFLIRVTEFFRDPGAFDALRDHVFPALRDRAAQQPIRIWVPGCATGEEVYSLAIALLEFLGSTPATIQIFGTDVSDEAIEKARAGVYPPNALRDISPERLQRFFVKLDDHYRIAKEVRDLCIFARQDVTRDPPFSRLDLISCRNLLIYLDEAAQRRILQVFHFALRPEGMILFGPAESIGQSSELFEKADTRVRLYRRRPGGAIRAPVRSPVAQNNAIEPPARVEAESLAREADRWLLSRYAPPSLVVDEALNILQFRGRTGPYLEPVSGPPSFDLRRVLRPELLVELLPALREAGETNMPVHRDGLRLDGAVDVNIEVVPLTGSKDTPCYLILFNDATDPGSAVRRHAMPAPSLPESEKDLRIAQLQRELSAMRDYVQGAVEEHGNVTEALKSAHEEMLSANEEFQSTNEELETSKEELQSTNEELTTAIEELRNRNKELSVLNGELEKMRVVSERALAYADIIIETVREPLAVLDNDQRVQRVNRSFAEDMDVQREDVEGRFLHEIQDGLWDLPELRQRLRAVLGDGQSIDNWEIAREVPGRGRKVISLNAQRIPGDTERAELVLVAFDDVTDRANTTADLLANTRRKDEFLATLAHELRHPLTPIAHAIHLLQLGDTDAERNTLYGTIDRQSQRLLRFVNELVDVARLGRNGMEITREPVDLIPIVREAVDTVHPVLQRHRHRFTLALPTSALRVNGDRGRLSQAVINLLENAAKFTPPGGEIGLTLERRGDEAMLTVRDTGVGIAPENLERIFDLFTKSDTPVAHDTGGLGLGLSIVRGVLELHGGRVEARSKGVGTGSELIASLPALSDDEEAKPVSEAPRRVRNRGAATKSKRVLIVDDHEEITTSVMRLARTWGHEVATASDAESAIALAKRFRPDCAVLDIGLPRQSGYELARRLREMFPGDRLRLIALTGYADENVRNASLDAGFDAYLVKPGDIGELEKLIASDSTIQPTNALQ